MIQEINANKAPIFKEFTYGEHTITLSAGHIAVQTAASVWLTMGDCIVMVNVAHQAGAPGDRDFFPLTVNYKENFYAAGKIPGGFTRREGRPNEREVIICRLIDRSVRPMFEKSFMDEVQITVSLLQNDPNVEPDIPAMLATSAALVLSDLPFTPIASARVGFVNQKYVLNPGKNHVNDTRLDLVLSGTQDSCIMVESSAMELTEEQVLAGIAFGQEALQGPLGHIAALRTEEGEGSEAYTAAKAPSQVQNQAESVLKAYADDFKSAFNNTQKSLRNQARKALAERIHSDFNFTEDTLDSEKSAAIHAAEKQWVRQQILAKQPRIDGRAYNEVRPIQCDIGVLPKGPHGSALFTRGETQALVTVTMGSDGDAQLIDEVRSNSKDSFMLQYNFPPYSVGECGMATSPKRREIGHGRLAKKAVLGVLPNANEGFPYTLRVVSEILSSNGSSSMATVCGASLSLMDAGVPIKDAVAGIAMGLVLDTESDNYTVLSDILGDEDHLGDMDFKVAGTKNGITALQMDLKVSKLPMQVFQEALQQAHTGRMHILDVMSTTIQKPKTEYAAHAPQMRQLQVPQSKISAVIGRGGATIKELIETYDVSIDIGDTGLVKISGSNLDNIKQAEEQIKKITLEIKIGGQYDGKIVKIMEFGAFVNLTPGKDAFLHISQIAEHRVENINDELSEGQLVRVKVTEIDEKQKRVKVTMRNIVQAATAE